MTKVISLISSIAAISLLSAASVSAADFATAPGTYKASGLLELFQTIPDVACQVDMDIVVDAAGNAEARNVVFSPGHPLCGTLIRPLTTTWPISKISKGVDEGDISLNVNVQAGAGTCVGTLSSTLTLYWGTKGPNAIATNPTATVAGSPSVCTVTGVLDITPTGGTVGEFRMQ